MREQLRLAPFFIFCLGLSWDADYTRSKMKPGFQIAAGAYSSYVTRAIWKGFRSRFHFGMGINDFLAVKGKPVPMYR